MKTFSTPRKPQPDRWKKALSTLFWIGLWQFLHQLVGLDLLVPSPLAVVRRLGELAGTGNFWRVLGTSCLRVLVGFTLALVVGAAMGALSAYVPSVYHLFQPLLRIVSTTPVASFIILALIWIQSGRLPVFITFLMVLPLVWNNLYQGIQHYDRQLLEMLQVYEVPFAQRWKAFYLPSLLPYLTASISSGVGFAWKAGIAAEVIAQPDFSIGKHIHNAKIYLETTDLFAWTVAVILLSFGLEFLVSLGLARLQKKGECYGEN